MNKSEMKQTALAIMCGDAYVDTNLNSGKSRLDIYHSNTQKEYLEQKAVWLNSINDVDCRIVEKIDKRPLVGGNHRVGWRLQTNFSRYFYNLSVAPDKYKLKQLVKPKALAILWQDDGTISWSSKGHYSTAVLCTDSWSDEFIKGFNREFNNEYGWCPSLMYTVCRGKPYTRLRFVKNEMTKLSDIIKNYVSPCMKYKIIS